MQINIPETTLTRAIQICGGIGRHKDTGALSFALVISTTQTAPAAYRWTFVMLARDKAHWFANSGNV